MPQERKKQSRGLELTVSWMLGALVLLISNSTIFKRLDASIGEPWLNLLLSAVVLTLLARIALMFQRLQREIKWSNSRIARVDGLDPLGFALHMQDVYRRQGWDVLLPQPKPLASEGEVPGGVWFIMQQGRRSVAAAFLTGRRKLTKEYVGAASSRLRSGGARESGVWPELWLVTNASFTAQACREASKLGVRLVDRGALINLLAEAVTLQGSGRSLPGR